MTEGLSRGARAARETGGAAPPRGLVARMVTAWRDPAGSFDVERPAGEPRLLAYAFGASLFITLGRMTAEVVRPSGMIAAAEQGIDPIGWLAIQVFAGLSFLPLALYGVAALLGLIARRFGECSWSDARLALFWSGFAAGPLGLVAYGVGAFASGGALAGGLAGVIWLGLLAPMLARAGGFSPVRVGLVFVAVVLAAFALRAVA